jgi:hypothetical protein
VSEAFESELEDSLFVEDSDEEDSAFSRARLRVP